MQGRKKWGLVERTSPSHEGKKRKGGGVGMAKKKRATGKIGERKKVVENNQKDRNRLLEA